MYVNECMWNFIFIFFSKGEIWQKQNEKKFVGMEKETRETCVILLRQYARAKEKKRCTERVYINNKKKVDKIEK